VRKKFVLLVFISQQLTFGAAPNSIIEGYIRDSQTNDPLPGANVILVGTGFGASTNTDGKYIIKNVPAGSYTIRASYIGYNQKENTLEVTENANLQQNLTLQAVGIEGQEVTVTAQAMGQNEAINQQLAAASIVNVVSAARIQEIPDVNAAESVTRLPGISIMRDGGEGSKVVIRGLLPKYNAVTINGVRMASNDPSDRSVDLSMISSNVLEGIEVMKAITPDQDADVIGGSVNFKLREARETGTAQGIDILSQGGYNNLGNTYNDYKFVGSVESRFLPTETGERNLGLFVLFNTERKNRISNDLGASYRLEGPVFGKENPVYISSLNLTDNPRVRKRYGGVLGLDYVLPNGKINLTNFFNVGDTKTETRQETYDLVGNQHLYTATDGSNTLTVITNILSLEQRIAGFKIDGTLSQSYSGNKSPDNVTFDFIETSAGFAGVNNRIDPKLVPTFARDSLEITELRNIRDFNYISKDQEFTGALNFQTNVALTVQIPTVIKFGGKLRRRTRSYDFNAGYGRLDLASGVDVKQAILDEFPWMKQTVPSGAGDLPITLFRDPGFSYGTFLDGEYPMGIPINMKLVRDVMAVAKRVGTLDAYSYDSYGSLANDYSGSENTSAAYVMADINLGQQVKIIPGVRYQRLTTSYSGPRGRIFYVGATSNYIHRDTTVERVHNSWLPMVHVRYKPIEWFDVRFAYTNTLTYPDYQSIVPRIDIGSNYVVWNNYNLNPAYSKNYDLYFSFYENNVGLFTAGGFIKEIDDLIFFASKRVEDPSRYEGLPATTVLYSITTTFNNPNRVNLWGIELDWQTHFWYLPAPFGGLVLNANYTHVVSDAKYPLSRISNLDYYLDAPGPPYVTATQVDTFYTDRLLRQPRDIVNISAGYDYSGFSARLSMLFQTNVFGGDNFWPEMRAVGDDYLRWDLSVKQNLPWFGLQLFLNLNNINSARDVTLNQGSSFPNAEQYYGMTADVGLRWKF